MSSDRSDIPASEKMRMTGSEPEDQSSSRFWTIAAGSLGAVLLFGFCVCGGIGWWFSPKLDENPEAARELVRDMVDIQIPDAFQPVGTIQWNVAFLLRLRGAYYERYLGDGKLTLVEVNSGLANDADLRRHIRETLLAEGAGGTTLVIDESKTKVVSLEVRGKKVNFTIEQAEDPVARRMFHFVEGVFDGRNGQILLSCRIEDDQWDEQEILRMLYSLSGQEPPPPAAATNPTSPAIAPTNEPPGNDAVPTDAISPTPAAAEL